ncbi:hypothetical protein [Haloechinothrix sp. LS1_15]|uniref:hypothetical protein n=1 Tax=Haloechinothrix sp. LS1_15 TaxID=2652248 RepID=UPI00294819DB|nr:hypothetical protein [Haloechinothrix sp. LS1_15]MDV6013950.1 hypothetical protein [Haloechinothrix sp. LS1_15]
MLGGQRPDHPSPDQPARTVDTSVMLWLIAAGCALVSVLLALVSLDALVAVGAAEVRAAAEPTAESVARVAIVLGLLLRGMLAASWPVLALVMRHARRAWARSLLTCTGAVWAVLTLLGIGNALAAGKLAAVMALLDIVTVGIAAVATVTMYRVGPAPGKAPGQVPGPR